MRIQFEEKINVLSYKLLFFSSDPTSIVSKMIKKIVFSLKQPRKTMNSMRTPYDGWAWRLMCTISDFSRIYCVFGLKNGRQLRYETLYYSIRFPRTYKNTERTKKREKRLKSGRKSRKTTSATLSTERGDLYGKKCECSFVPRIIKTLPDEFVKRWLIIKNMMARVRFCLGFFRVRTKENRFWRLFGRPSPFQSGSSNKLLWTCTNCHWNFLVYCWGGF